MRFWISLGLALRFFKRPLFSFLLLFALVGCCVFSLFLVIDSYAYQMEKRFAAKQPHLTISLNSGHEKWQEVTQEASFIRLKAQLERHVNVLAVSEFIKVKKWLRLKAATSQISGFEAEHEFDKFSSGDVTLIAIERRLPAVMPLSDLNYYDAGPYKFKISNLEYASDWLTNPQLILPNAVLDASFYAPITQQVSVKQAGNTYQGQIKAFINDYADESILYMGLDQISHWQNAEDIQETGLFVRLRDSHQLGLTKEAIQTVLAKSKHDWSLTSWLDAKNKQKSILIMTQMVGYSVIGLLFILLLLVLTLNLTNVFILKAKSLEILFMTGYWLTGPLLINSIFVSFIGLFGAYFVTIGFLEPIILSSFSINTSFSYFWAWFICLSALVLVNVINLIGMKTRLGY